MDCDPRHRYTSRRSTDDGRIGVLLVSLCHALETRLPLSAFPVSEGTIPLGECILECPDGEETRPELPSS